MSRPSLHFHFRSNKIGNFLSSHEDAVSFFADFHKAQGLDVGRSVFCMMPYGPPTQPAIFLQLAGCTLSAAVLLT